MIATLFVTVAVLALVCAVNAGGSPSKKTISAAVKETGVDGLEGLNIKWEAPFKFDDYIVGFRYALKALKKAPESLFLKKTYDTPIIDGSTTVDLDYDVDSKELSGTAKWVSDNGNWAVEIAGNSKDYLSEVAVNTAQTIKEKKVDFEAIYNRISKTFKGEAKIAHEGTIFKVAGDSDKRDPVLSVKHKLDDKNSIEPSLSLKSCDITFGYTRSWEGGELETTYIPADEVVGLKWKDDGANGVWTTKANIPIKNTKASKVSFSREWKL